MREERLLVSSFEAQQVGQFVKGVSFFNWGSVSMHHLFDGFQPFVNRLEVHHPHAACRAADGGKALNILGRVGVPYHAPDSAFVTCSRKYNVVVRRRLVDEASAASINFHEGLGANAILPDLAGEHCSIGVVGIACIYAWLHHSAIEDCRCGLGIKLCANLHGDANSFSGCTGREGIAGNAFSKNRVELTCHCGIGCIASRRQYHTERSVYANVSFRRLEDGARDGSVLDAVELNELVLKRHLMSRLIEMFFKPYVARPVHGQIDAPCFFKRNARLDGFIGHIHMRNGGNVVIGAAIAVVFVKAQGRLKSFFGRDAVEPLFHFS